MIERCKIFGCEFDTELVAAWIKLVRLEKGINQDVLANGICSTSYLSYFESGRKQLNSEWIEQLLRKLGIDQLEEMKELGTIRQSFNHMCHALERGQSEEAKHIMNQLSTYQEVIRKSPYYLEWSVYNLVYTSMNWSAFGKEALLKEIDRLDKIVDQLPKKSQYWFYFASGNSIYRLKSHEEGIVRLKKAYDLDETAWVNYSLGNAYCFNEEQLQGVYHFEAALHQYESAASYINAVWCHNFLGVCYSGLGLETKALKHYQTALEGAQYFNVEKMFVHIYINLSHQYYEMGDYKTSRIWSEKAMAYTQAPLFILAVLNNADAAYEMKDMAACNALFDTYLKPEYEHSAHYLLLKFLYYKVHEFETEGFYEKVTKEILPFYQQRMYKSIVQDIEIQLAEYLEKNRRYKEACKLYKKYL